MNINSRAMFQGKKTGTQLFRLNCGPGGGAQDGPPRLVLPLPPRVGDMRPGDGGAPAVPEPRAGRLQPRPRHHDRVPGGDRLQGDEGHLQPLGERLEVSPSTSDQTRVCTYKITHVADVWAAWSPTRWDFSSGGNRLPAWRL